METLSFTPGTTAEIIFYDNFGRRSAADLWRRSDNSVRLAADAAAASCQERQKRCEVVEMIDGDGEIISPRHSRPPRVRTK